MGVVGENAPDFGGRNEDIIGPLDSVEALDCRGVEEVKFDARTSDEMPEVALLQFTPKCAAHESTVAGNINPGLWRKSHASTITTTTTRDKSYGFEVPSLKTGNCVFRTVSERVARLVGGKSRIANSA